MVYNPTKWKMEKRLAVAVKCGFQVLNLDEFHQRMTEHNVPCVPEPTETFGAGIAQHVDPDGLILCQR